MSTTIDQDRVLAFAEAWVDSTDGKYPQVAGITDQEISVAMVLVGYDTPSHAELVMPEGHFEPASRIAAEIRGQDLW